LLKHAEDLAQIEHHLMEASRIVGWNEHLAAVYDHSEHLDLLEMAKYIAFS